LGASSPDFFGAELGRIGIALGVEKCAVEALAVLDGQRTEDEMTYAQDTDGNDRERNSHQQHSPFASSVGYSSFSK
jgi:hypothetical protein